MLFLYHNIRSRYPSGYLARPTINNANQDHIQGTSTDKTIRIVSLHYYAITPPSNPLAYPNSSQIIHFQLPFLRSSSTPVVCPPPILSAKRQSDPGSRKATKQKELLCVRSGESFLLSSKLYLAT